MERIAQGSEAALAELLSRYWTPLLRFAFRYLDDADAAEDVVQEAFSRVWLHRDRWHSGGTPSGYLYRIVRNLAIHEQEKRKVRSRWNREQRLRVGEEACQEPDSGDEVRSALEAAVAALPARRRDVFILGGLHGLPYKEIAEVMGISAQTVANQMSAALRQLREALAEYRP
ncbi:MAG TPA: RNA polymerase sigma-70 factor [Longimicrobiaceae bacterium]|nr:RNA polymerase sigma-70 factor [Longimicrobiaceae bacterium]